MLSKQIKLGLPKGSLNTVSRGNTYGVFVNAGYNIQGYEPGHESSSVLSIGNDKEILPFLTRPQSAPIELTRLLLDIAITGEDWIKEEGVNSIRKIHKIGDLEYGETRLVIAVPNQSNYESLSDFFRSLKKRAREKPILCFTEYVNLTSEAFMKNEAYQDIFGNKKPLVQIRGLTNGENKSVQILSSDGVTEGYIAKGADIIADNCQSGKSLKKFGLRELEQIMVSSAGLYAGPSCVDWKNKKAHEIYEQLHGAVIALQCFDVKFNIPSAKAGELETYFLKKGLSAYEPTMIFKDRLVTVNIIIPRAVFPKILQILRSNFNASAIIRNKVEQYIK